MKRENLHDGHEKLREHRDRYNKFTDLELIWLSVFAQVRDEQVILEHFSKTDFSDSFPIDFCVRGRTSCSMCHTFSNQVDPNSYPDFYKRKVTPCLKLSHSNWDLTLASVYACSQPTMMTRVENQTWRPARKKSSLQHQILELKL